MTEFNKVEYWKTRMTKELSDTFQETIIMLRELQSNFVHLIGKEPVEFGRVFKEIGASYDELYNMVQALQKKEKKEKGV